jgi:CRISPR/Cas system CSM-associated protein Csm5 (group 7 of RAMP superfamily)
MFFGRKIGKEKEQEEKKRVISMPSQKSKKINCYNLGQASP